ncbi:hypothetical protein HYT02_01400 [Candidatus Gottesmanbacteria bacterium]|nr:hypothetical protein [Candidatus Gottesmanbacteria bacterium]
MKSKLPIKLREEFEVIAQKGAKVKAGEKIARSKKTAKEEKIPISEILSINSSNIPKYLTRRIGSKVKRGEVIAKKDNFIKSIKIVSPFDGTISSIDLKKGILILESQVQDEEYTLAPIEGVITEILESEIILSVEGDLVSGTKGQGKTLYGEVIIFNVNQLDIFDFASEVSGKVVMAPLFTEGALSKLYALDAVGVISTQFYPQFPAIVVVEKDLYHKLAAVKPGKLILLGSQASIIIPKS